MFLDESGTDGVELSRKEAIGRRVADAIMSLYNVRDFQIECARVLHETLLIPSLIYGSKTMLWEERSRIRAVQIDNFRALLGIRRIDRVPSARIRKLCGGTKGIDERIDEGVLRWFDHVERLEEERIAKRVCGRNGLIPLRSV